ncbi:MAG TPA: PqqD family protein [Polyangiaceae bacterium]|jgi:hypothetical protein|nr:PqqD family protein [Polyangiaceae bacterium]
MSQSATESSVPLRAWDVRKRRRASGTVLIRLSEVLAISPFEERLWRLCDGERTVAQLVKRISQAETGADAAPLLERVRAAVARLATRRMLELREADQPRATATNCVGRPQA